MLILGIDTSCDDTCVSLLKIENCKLKILSNVVSSQVKLHAKYGGVYPFLAKREHQRNLPIVLKKALKKANFSISNFKFLISKKNPNNKINHSLFSTGWVAQPLFKGCDKIPKIDLIGVTVGPGLEPCLWQGINFAKDLAQKIKKPLIPVNHIEAHIIANWLTPISDNPKSQSPNSKQILNSKFQNSKLFPAICLVVSGGHTQLILIKGIGKYKLIGETRDDAAGECFDKTARILGLGYPGGPIVAKMATKIKNQKSKIKNIKLPRPMMHTKDYDFSFSGLKTAVLYEFKKQPTKIKKSKIYIQAICAEIQEAIVDVLIKKTIKAAKDFRVKTIILGGGVAANEELRRQFKLKIKNLKLKINFFAPEKILCTDNAAMVAVTAYFHKKEATKNWQKIEANANLRI